MNHINQFESVGIIEKNVDREERDRCERWTGTKLHTLTNYIPGMKSYQWWFRVVHLIQILQYCLFHSWHWDKDVDPEPETELTHSDISFCLV